MSPLEQHKFHPGDQIKCIDDSELMHGELKLRAVYTVVDVSNSSARWCKIKPDPDGCRFWYPPERFIRHKPELDWGQIIALKWNQTSDIER